MPSITLTIEDNSPIISYSTGWRAGHSADDELANLYVVIHVLCLQDSEILFPYPIGTLKAVSPSPTSKALLLHSPLMEPGLKYMAQNVSTTVCSRSSWTTHHIHPAVGMRPTQAFFRNQFSLLVALLQGSTLLH